MSGKTRLIITECELHDRGILITEMKVIDGVSGEILRIAKLTPELRDFLKALEISIDDYFAVMELKKKNCTFYKLIETFNLTLEKS